MMAQVGDKVTVREGKRRVKGEVEAKIAGTPRITFSIRLSRNRVVVRDSDGIFQ